MKTKTEANANPLNWLTYLDDVGQPIRANVGRFEELLEAEAEEKERHARRIRDLNHEMEATVARAEEAVKKLWAEQEIREARMACVANGGKTRF